MKIRVNVSERDMPVASLIIETKPDELAAVLVDTVAADETISELIRHYGVDEVVFVPFGDGHPWLISVDRERLIMIVDDHAAFMGTRSEFFAKYWR